MSTTNAGGVLLMPVKSARSRSNAVGIPSAASIGTVAGGAGGSKVKRAARPRPTPTPPCTPALEGRRRGLGLDVWWLISGMSAASDVKMTRKVEETGRAVGTVLGGGIIVAIWVIWVAGSVILGLFVLFTRPKS